MIGRMWVAEFCQVVKVPTAWESLGPSGPPQALSDALASIVENKQWDAQFEAVGLPQHAGLRYTYRVRCIETGQVISL